MNGQTDTGLATGAEAARGCVCFNLRRAARAVTQLYDAALEPSGLRATQFSLLVALRLAGPVTISRLARQLVTDRTTLTRNLKPLEKHGLIEIVTGADRRTRTVRLTARGREALATALPRWRRVQADLVGGLGEERWRRLMPDLAAAVEAVAAVAATRR